MTTASGEVINLGKLCGSQQRQRRSVPTGQGRSRPQPQPSGIKVQEGRDRGDNETDYNFEIWATNNRRTYKLKVWEAKNYPRTAPYYTQDGFASALEALNAFECEILRKKVAACSN
jgi:hypothetical protein